MDKTWYFWKNIDRKYIISFAYDAYEIHPKLQNDPYTLLNFSYIHNYSSFEKLLFNHIRELWY